MQRMVLEMRVPALLCFVATALACGTQAAPRATIEGQVIGANGQPATGLDARMAGTPRSAVTDAGGRFSLSAASSGPSVLQLGHGSDASVELPPATDGMVVRVAVGLSTDGKAALQGDPEVMLRGKIASVDGSDFRIGATTIRTDGDSSVLADGDSIRIDGDMIGEVADVQGLLRKDGSVLARKIHTAFHPGKKTEFKGTIQTIVAPDRLVVDGTTVVADAKTHIEVAGKKASFSALAPGQKVEVEGVLQRDRSVLASSIEAQAAPAPAPRPVANAGPDQSANAGAPVTLDGSASTDPSGLPLSFQWTQASGLPVTLAGANTARPSFTAPSVAFGLPAASLVFSLVVSDAKGASAPDTVTITVNAVAPAPIANAGPGQRVASATLVTLDGSASSDPAGLPLTFVWSQASGLSVTLSDAAAAKPTFTAPAIAPGLPAASLTFTLVVSDAKASSAPASVTVTVDPQPAPPRAPIANAGPNQTVDSGAQVTLDGTASTDPAGLPISFAWTQASGPSVPLAGADTANPSFTAPAIPAGQPAGVLVFALVVTDANLSSAPSTVTITVNPLKLPPIANAGPDQAVDSGALVTLDGSASSDPAGLPLTFAWTQTAGPIVTLSSATVSNPSFTAPTVDFTSPPAVVSFSLTVSDANLSSAPSLVNITVNPAAPPNPAPVANAGPDQSVASAASVTLDGRGSFDPDGEAITFAWTQSSGSAVTLTGADTAQPSFSAPAVPAGSPAATLVFSLVVTDAHASSPAASVIITVNPAAAAFPPPPGTPPPAAPNPNPPPNGGSGSNRFEVGAANGLYLVNPATGEPSIQGFVVVTLGPIRTGTFIPPADTVVTINGVPLCATRTSTGPSSASIRRVRSRWWGAAGRWSSWPPAPSPTAPRCSATWCSPAPGTSRWPPRPTSAA